MGDWLMQSICSPSSRTLCLEMQRASLAISWTAFAVLQDEGIDPRHLAGLTGSGDIGRMRVEFCRDGSWNPVDAGGSQALILPILDAGMLVDMVAFSPRSPDQWALRRGDGRLLGADQLSGCGDWQTGVREVRVFANPMEWLIAGGDGICVLVWDDRAVRELAALGPKIRLMADSHELGEHIEQKIKAVPVLPEVGVQTAQIMTLEAAE